MELTIVAEDPETRDACLLLERLETELAGRYGDDGKTDFTPEQVRVSGSVFLVARLGGRPVGCGALRPMEPGVVEVKRMFIEPDARGRGLAGRILTELETCARAMGYRAVRLETGTLQPEAIRLYEREGYRRIANYGKYVDNPLSVCFEKAIEDLRGG
jgi:GNAT superfamily N-acetyltransferase